MTQRKQKIRLAHKLSGDLRKLFKQAKLQDNPKRLKELLTKVSRAVKGKNPAKINRPKTIDQVIDETVDDVFNEFQHHENGSKRLLNSNNEVI